MMLCILAVERAEPCIACIFAPPLMEDGQTVETRKRGKLGNPKYGESLKQGSSAFRHHSSVSTFVLSPRLSSLNRTNVPPLNIAIIPWRQLGHTVLIFKSGSHSWVQSRMQLCIQSCAGVKKILLTPQLI